jgi:RNA polymerase sigma factor (sigma-70 family)
MPTPPPAAALTAALRAAAPRALAILVRRIGNFDDAEDAVQEALIAAARRWPTEGIPNQPVAWLVTVATRRAIDTMRSEIARRERERRMASMELTVSSSDEDDTLLLFLLCCHPAMSHGSQVALTLRCVGGLTTREIARGLMLPEATVGTRISRAKSTLRGIPLDSIVDVEQRLPAVLDVLGLIHTESHTAVEGDAISRPALAAESLRLARTLLEHAPDAWRGEVMGLIALILLTDARQPARVDSNGVLVPLAEQDRALWRPELIAEGVELLTEALRLHPLGRFQLRAAIAAVHDEAVAADATDWRQILALYDVLCVLDPGPISALGRCVAIGEVHGADAGLEEVNTVTAAPAQQTFTVRAHMLARAGRAAEARDAYALAARLTRNESERRWLLRAAAAAGSGRRAAGVEGRRRDNADPTAGEAPWRPDDTKDARRRECQ